MKRTLQMIGRAYLCIAWAGYASAVQTPEQCQASKLKAAGKKASCRTNEMAKQIRGASFDLSKCSTKLSSSFAKADAKGGCLTTGDEAIIEGRIDASTDLIKALLSGGRLVFVSSGIYAATLGGLSGADATCNSLAASAGLPGTYKAWLSDSASSPSTRFTQATVPYVLVNGTVIGNNWADLTDGSLAAPINVTEAGITPPSDPCCGGHVWTATQSDGSVVAGETCSDWTDAGLVNGHRGNRFATDSTWTDLTDGPCNQPARLYCFQQ